MKTPKHITGAIQDGTPQTQTWYRVTRDGVEPVQVAKETPKMLVILEPGFGGQLRERRVRKEPGYWGGEYVRDRAEAYALKIEQLERNIEAGRRKLEAREELLERMRAEAAQDGGA